MKRNLVTTVLVVCALVAGVLLGMLLAGSGNGIFDRKGDKLYKTMSLIDKYYVDKVDMDSLAEATIPLVLRQLDPHSVYIPAAEFKAVNEPMQGEFDGIGVVFNMLTDTVQVINVILSGPSDRAGVQNGDRIIKINDSLVAGRGIPQDSIVKLLRGPRGTTVKVSIERRGATGLFDTQITRGAIPIKALDAAFMLPGNVAFVKLSRFSKASYPELLKALADMHSQGMKKLILDLRGNTGGYFEQALNIANMFLDKGQLIVYTKDRAGERVEQLGNGRGVYNSDLPLAVLIDQESASSSEILAGAIKDNGRGVVVGNRSFGKGLVQNEILYPDGSALRLAIARYYTPSGLNVQGSGIEPNYVVPANTTGYSDYYAIANGMGLIYKYAAKWSDGHRAELNVVRTQAEFDAMLDRLAGRHLVDDFVAYAAKNGLTPNRKQIETSRRILNAVLRANIGSNSMLEHNAFYAEIYPIDTTVTKALEVLK